MIQLLTVPETAARLGCCRDHVYTLLGRGDLRAVDIGTTKPKTRIREDDLAAYIDGRTRVPLGRALRASLRA